MTETLVQVENKETSTNNTLNQLLVTMRSLVHTRIQLGNYSEVDLKDAKCVIERTLSALFDILAEKLIDNETKQFYLSSSSVIKYQLKKLPSPVNGSIIPLGLHVVNKHNGYISGKNKSNLAALDLVYKLEDDIIYIDDQNKNIFEKRISLLKELISIDLSSYRDKHARKDSTGLDQAISYIIDVFDNTVVFERAYPSLAYKGTLGAHGAFKPLLESYLKNEAEFTWLEINAIVEELKKHLAAITEYSFSN